MQGCKSLCAAGCVCVCWGAAWCGLVVACFVVCVHASDRRITSANCVDSARKGRTRRQGDRAIEVRAWCMLQKREKSG